MTSMAPKKFEDRDERWAAVRDRNGTADGSFVFAVTTTGIFCRPGCPSRTPRRENVVFFDGPDDAAAAGFRPCRRCRPDEAAPGSARTAAVVAACRRIMTSEAPVTLEVLASGSGLSPGRFHRLFKSVVGVTPTAFAATDRANRFLDAIDRGATVTEAVYEAGFSSPGRAHATLKSAMSLTPGEYRRGAEGLVIRYAVAECFLGWTVVAATEKGLCAVLFDDGPEVLPSLLKERFPKARLIPTEPEESAIISQAIAGIGRPSRGADVPLDIMGTAFQRRVWNAIRAIPPGETAGYGEIAARLGDANAARAVAGACAANRIAYYIPCHRVVPAAGGTGGYRWGTKRKRRLLDAEKPDEDETDGT